MFEILPVPRRPNSKLEYRIPGWLLKLKTPQMVEQRDSNQESEW